MANIFDSIAIPRVGSNKFNLSHDVKMSFQMGWLTPSCVMECNPGDKFTIGVENMLRFAPLQAPLMHTVNVTTHFFFVPNRILWPEWEDWITGESTAEVPYVTSDGASNYVGRCMDYLGYPTNVDTNLQMSAFPIAAYIKIYNEYYRDQNLVSEYDATLVAGNNNTNQIYDDGTGTENYQARLQSDPFRRAWMHDYFTSALPFAQKGDAVTIPLTANDDPLVQYANPNDNIQIIRDTVSDAVLDPGGVAAPATRLVAPGVQRTDAGGNILSNTVFNLDPNGTMYVDINEEAADITTLRRAFRLQEFLERDARGGTRYIENIHAHFGVRSSDKRLQRPEYIGGTKQRMVISEVLSTTETLTPSDDSVSNPVGQLAGHGISVGGGNRFSFYCEEHGWIIGIVNVQPVTAYSQGLHRSYFRFDRLDYFWPKFQHIGEQAVLNKEIYAEDTIANGELTFGYTPRYSELKYMNSRIAGDFKTSLNFWHLGEIYTAQPNLNRTFIECNPSHRVFAVTDSSVHKIYAHIFNNVYAVRKMARYGNPLL